MDHSEKIYILVVDDNKDNLLSLSAQVEDAGGCPVTATSGETALALLDMYPFALALLDVIMPGLSGFDLASRIIARPGSRDLPIIFISGIETDQDKVLNGYGQGAVDYLIKPVHPLVLKNKVRYFTELFRQKTYGERITSSIRTSREKGYHHQDNHTVAELAGGIAHQFNNNLNIITGNVELLKMDIQDKPCVKEFSTVIFESVRKMTALTDKLLAYARAGNHKMGQVEFNSILRQALAEIPMDKKKISLETRLDSGSIHVDADESHLKMVFAALLNNAVEAITDKGQITVRTRYLPSVDGDTQKKLERVCLEVEDNGQGMAPDICDRIFEPFFSTKFQGRGLDMAAVQGIVRNHNGLIDVTSHPGKGTLVRVEFPVASYRKASTFHQSEAWGTATGCVLVIDDDEALRGLTVTMLNRLGYKALTASTGQEAIEVVRKESMPIDLALLDVEMPDMRGNDVYPHLISARPELKVVVCSGYSLDGPVQDLLKQGAKVFLQKPFSFSDLARILQTLIERRRYTRYDVNEGLIVFHHGKKTLEQNLIDISQGGASIRNLNSPVDQMGWGALTIVADNGAFQIPDIPFQFIPKSPYAHGPAKGLTASDRLSMRFGELNAHQSRQVDYFIANYAL